MSSLALHLQNEGHTVSGSDLKKTEQTDTLESVGINVHFGDLSRFPSQADRIVLSSAIPDDHPEVLEARKRKIPIVHRAEELSRLFNNSHGIAVAGSHGKTTTSALLTHILISCGESPSAMVGGCLAGYQTNAFLGKGPYFVAEADESDGSLIAYKAKNAVVTSVDDDVNVTAPAYSQCGYSRSKVQQTVNSLFLSFAKNTEEGLWICHDHPRAGSLLGRLPEVRTYGTDGSCTLRAKILERAPSHSKAGIIYNGKKLGDLRVPMPGHHNVLNSLAALGIALDLGLPFEDVAHSIAMFKGVGRRFENVGSHNGCLCIDDYAHNPQKVVAALQASIQVCRGRVIALFQPHRYTRMKLLGEAFLPALDGADKVLLTDVFTSGEEPNGFDIETFHQALQERAPRDTIYRTPDEAEVHRALDSITRPGDLIISLGAGSCGQWLRNWVTGASKPELAA